MRVHSSKKSNRGRDYHCDRCGKKIEPGERYIYWTFYRGSTHTRCSGCPYPRQSELTESNMQSVYQAKEHLEDLSDFSSVDEVQSAIAEAVSMAEESRDLYQEAAEAWGEAGYEHQEKADAVDAYISELEELDIPEPPDEEDDEHGVALETWREEVRTLITEPEVQI